MPCLVVSPDERERTKNGVFEHRLTRAHELRAGIEPAVNLPVRPSALAESHARKLLKLEEGHARVWLSWSRIIR
jgi:hypothetical protein